MSACKHIDRVCAIAAALSLVIALLFMNGAALGIQPLSQTAGYEARLFDPSRVHTIDIVMDDWDSFIETCENEEYAACAVVIDNEAYKNVGLRAKGNTSLSTVSRMDSDRYSFKIEFDCYDSGKTYYGLDKLSLNNIIQDSTFMKDCLAYRLMGAFGVNAPLCSYVYITVNGQDWGLYLAVEGVEDGFLQRNYGQNHGELYKPDSMSFGGGRGNGREFNMEDFSALDQGESMPDSLNFGGGRGNGWEFDTGDVFDFFSSGQGNDMPDRDNFGGGGGMGSADVKLQYIDDNPDSYANIFDNAKTDVTQAGRNRLIQSLKALSEGGDPSDAVDIDQVLRYFVVHNFVVNGDSYTGSMVHNYYLYEENGRLSMIPWDYNLAFGTFQGGDASAAVNDPIDSPLSVTGNGDRPMADWMFSSEEYTRQYHQYFQEFLDTVDAAAIIDSTYALIAPYVERDPTKFCTADEFEAGVDALKTFCILRAESVSGQLAGTIPSTSEGQAADRNALVDTSALTMSDMGGMDRAGGRGEQREDGLPTFGGDAPTPSEDGFTFPSAPAGFEGGQRPGGMQPGDFSGGFPGGGLGSTPENAVPGERISQAGTSLLLLALSALVLLAGLAVAFKFKR